MGGLVYFTSEGVKARRPGVVTGDIGTSRMSKVEGRSSLDKSAPPPPTVDGCLVIPFVVLGLGLPLEDRLIRGRGGGNNAVGLTYLTPPSSRKSCADGNENDRELDIVLLLILRNGMNTSRRSGVGMIGDGEGKMVAVVMVAPAAIEPFIASSEPKDETEEMDEEVLPRRRIGTILESSSGGMICPTAILSRLNDWPGISRDPRPTPCPDFCTARCVLERFLSSVEWVLSDELPMEGVDVRVFACGLSNARNDNAVIPLLRSETTRSLSYDRSCGLVDRMCGSSLADSLGKMRS